MLTKATTISPFLLAIALIVWFGKPAVAQEVAQPFDFHLGGGIGIPVGSTSKFVRTSGTVQLGGGPRVTKHNYIVFEAMWQFLPGRPLEMAQPVNPLFEAGFPNGSSTFGGLAGLMLNYMYRVDGHRYGFYLIGGAGWYSRGAQNANDTISHSVSAGGMNAGGGFTLGLGVTHATKLYTEVRYHYSPQGGTVPTQMVPVTFGIRW
jgi:hypothetical protein